MEEIFCNRKPSCGGNILWENIFGRKYLVLIGKRFVSWLRYDKVNLNKCIKFPGKP